MKLISKYLNLKLIWFQANFVVSWPLFSLRYDLATFPAGKSCLLTPWWNRSECKVLFVYYFWLRIRTLSLSDVDATRRTLLALEWCGILLLSHMELLLMSSETQNRQYSDMPPSAGRASAEYPWESDHSMPFFQLFRQFFHNRQYQKGLPKQERSTF